MLSIRKLSYNLQDLKTDPIERMELIYRRSSFLPDHILDDEKKEWIGKVYKTDGKFKVRRLISGIPGRVPSRVIIAGHKSTDSNTFDIKLTPSIYFYINILGVPIFLFFLFRTLEFSLIGDIIAGLIFIIYLLLFIIDLNNSENKIIDFLERLK